MARWHGWHGWQAMAAVALKRAMVAAPKAVRGMHCNIGVGMPHAPSKPHAQLPAARALPPLTASAILCWKVSLGLGTLASDADSTSGSGCGRRPGLLAARWSAGRGNAGGGLSVVGRQEQAATSMR